MGKTGNVVPTIVKAEHIGPDDTGDNIEAKRVAVYGFDGTNWARFAVNASGVVLTTPVTFSTTTNSTVASSASNVTLASANTSRKELTITNDSTAILYLKEGTTATSTDYKFKLYPDAVYRTNNYTGRVDGIWASANGSARVAES